MLSLNFNRNWRRAYDDRHFRLEIRSDFYRLSAKLKCYQYRQSCAKLYQLFSLKIISYSLKTNCSKINYFMLISSFLAMFLSQEYNFHNLSWAFLLRHWWVLIQVILQYWRWKTRHLQNNNFRSIKCAAFLTLWSLWF